jgi:hypothetical protein
VLIRGAFPGRADRITLFGFFPKAGGVIERHPSVPVGRCMLVGRTVQRRLPLEAQHTRALPHRRLRAREQQGIRHRSHARSGPSTSSGCCPRRRGGCTPGCQERSAGRRPRCGVCAALNIRAEATRSSRTPSLLIPA